MKAVGKTRPEEGLDLIDVPEPGPALDEVLLRVEAASLCGSDLEINRWKEPFASWMRRLPVVVGHEFSGTVVEVGRAVTHDWVGKRVAVDPGVTCGVCWRCRAGQPNLCPERKIIGIHRDGAFASLVTVPLRCCYPVPESLSPQDATLLESFGVATHAYRVANLRGGEKCAVIGPGPIGLGVVAQITGLGSTAIVVGAEADRGARFESAHKLGAQATLCIDDRSDRSQVEDLKGSFDVVFCTTGAAGALASSIALAKIGGVAVMVGVTGASTVPIDLRRLVLDQVEVRGVRGRETEDWRRALLLMEKLDLSPITGPSFALERYAEAYEACERGDVAKVFLVPT